MDELLELTAGNIDLLADRSQEASMMPQPQHSLRTGKVTHFRSPAAGPPMWSGQAVYDASGESPAVSTYDQHDPYGDIPDFMNYQVRDGVASSRELVPVDEYSTTRSARTSAHYDSSPAARFFQGFANLRWSGLMIGRPQIRPRPLTQNMNPGAFGAAELHRATQYKPVPPMGAIVGTFGTEKAL